jgi:hypothetical protein
MATSTAKITWGSILQTITSSANTVTTSIDMLEAFVSKSSLEQQYEYSKEYLVFKEETDTAMADRLATNGLVIKKKCEDPEYAELFNHYLKLIKDEK